MKFLHTMIRITDVDKNLDFFCKGLGLKEIRRHDYPKGEFTLIFLATVAGAPEIELTYNWGSKQEYVSGRNFGHIAFEVENIYTTCQHLINQGIDILRPPRDGYMAFIKSPDNISIELLQKGGRLVPSEPWVSMPNKGEW
ncbi:MAG: VOC family protein [Oligoflexales bacterium]